MATGMRVASRVRALAMALAAAGTACPAACGGGPAGVDACKAVEDARCRAASACGVSLQPPYSNAGTDADACIRFYDVACLHGLASGNDPGPAAVNACVARIASHPCDKGGPNLVQSPESDPACAWLVPPAAAATSDASGAEASSEAGSAESGAAGDGASD
jgi:hypothetical protein